VAPGAKAEVDLDAIAARHQRVIQRIDIGAGDIPWLVRTVGVLLAALQREQQQARLPFG